MNAHMQINSPLLRQQAMEHAARRERLWPRSKMRRPVAKILHQQFNAHVVRRQQAMQWSTRKYDDADAHVRAWRAANFPGASPTRRVIEHAALHLGTTRRDILGQRKTHALARARQIAVYVVHWTTAHSLGEIGRRFGGRDHTTILHAIRAIGERAKSDATLRDDIEHVCAAAGLTWREGAPHAGA